MPVSNVTDVVLLLATQNRFTSFQCEIITPDFFFHFPTDLVLLPPGILLSHRS